MFPERVLFSLNASGCIVVWASVPPALQTHVIIVLVVHNIANYRVAVISVIEVAAMIFLPEALKQ